MAKVMPKIVYSQHLASPTPRPPQLTMRPFSAPRVRIAESCRDPPGNIGNRCGIKRKSPRTDLNTSESSRNLVFLGPHLETPNRHTFEHTPLKNPWAQSTALLITWQHPGCILAALWLHSSMLELWFLLAPAAFCSTPPKHQ